MMSFHTHPAARIATLPQLLHQRRHLQMGQQIPREHHLAGEPWALTEPPKERVTSSAVRLFQLPLSHFLFATFAQRTQRGARTVANQRIGSPTTQRRQVCGRE
jgi:hypothetical protein